jgi:hypothetical protein
MNTKLGEFTRGELVKLVDENWVGRAVIAITDAIEQSFNEDGLIVRIRTRNEITRRYEICIKWFVILRRDYGWSVPHILDSLSNVLRSELDGINFNVDDTSRWGINNSIPMEHVGDDMNTGGTDRSCGIETDDLFD